MGDFSLRLKAFTLSDFDESISLEVDIETWKSLRKIIKNFLEAREYL